VVGVLQRSDTVPSYSDKQALSTINRSCNIVLWNGREPCSVAQLQVRPTAINNTSGVVFVLVGNLLLVQTCLNHVDVELYV